MLIELLGASMGILKPGVASEVEVTVQNTSTRPITIAQTESTCECVHVTPGGFVVDPGSRQALRVHYEPESPIYRGRLRVEIQGRDLEGRARFRFPVRITVQADPLNTTRGHS